MHDFLILSLTCCACVGQSVSIGVVGGGRLTDDVTSGATPESRRYIIGPTVEVGLSLGFAVEFDALYHRQGYLFFLDDTYTPTTERERANSWEFPILLKYKLPIAKVKPFVELGVAPRIISGTVTDTGYTCANGCSGPKINFNYSASTNWPRSFGVVAGGGVHFELHRLRLSPEVRYTYWTSAPIFPSVSAFPLSNQNQLDVLVGIAWKIR